MTVPKSVRDALGVAEGDENLAICDAVSMELLAGARLHPESLG